MGLIPAVLPNQIRSCPALSIKGRRKRVHIAFPLNPKLKKTLPPPEKSPPWPRDAGGLEADGKGQEEQRQEKDTVMPPGIPSDERAFIKRKPHPGKIHHVL
jgi:hypothetical protein